MYSIFLVTQLMGAFIMDLVQELFDQDLEARQ